MSLHRSFNSLRTSTAIVAPDAAGGGFLRRLRWPLAAVLSASVLVPLPARLEESSTPPPGAAEAPKSEAPKSEAPNVDTNPPAATPAAPGSSPPAASSPRSEPMPEVLVRAARPKRAAAGPDVRAPARASRPVSGAIAPVIAAPASPLAAFGAQGVPGALAKPPGQAITTVSGERIRNEPAFTIQDLLQESPGVSFKQGNGPRDIGISIRGSNARNGFGIRNIVVLEDGFPVTQPDGLSRTDLMDPHAYGGADVYRGPSSAMFGNYATGGAINFRLWRGRDINGAWYGSEGGSFGYLNNYAIVGGRGNFFEGAAFASDVRGDGYISHSSFNTQTVNALGTFDVTPNDRVTFKFIDNRLATNLSVRLSLNQFQTNPFQSGCINARTAAPGCGTVNLFANGFSAPSVPQTAEEGAFGRRDYREIVGGRWEHDFDNQTTWRVQGVFDDKNINQPTGATSAIGDSPAYNLITNVTSRGGLFGFEAVHFAEMWYNRQRLTNYTWNVLPGGSLGSLQSFYDGGHHVNWGARAREEVAFGPHWIGYVAADIETTTIAAVNTNVSTFAGGFQVPTLFPIQRDFLNYAPEGGLLFRPNDVWQFRGRVGTGYGTPNIGNLTTNAQGVGGNNSQLAAQTNVGIDLGVDWTPNPATKLSVTGFYEFFRNEFVNQSPGAGLQNFTFNVPRSVHRGIEVAADWRPLPGWRLLAAYTWLDQFYVDYTEQLSAGALTRRFDRAGNKIPGISPSELFARLGYDQPVGPWKGVGAFVEYVWKDAFWMENANLLQAPGYALFNANIHYDTAIEHDYLKGAIFFFEVKNLLDKTYIASANNITNSINAATGLQNPAVVLANTGTGSIYAGAPRTFVGGMRLAFR
jgi:iron complex outermembrane recepter protein